MYIVNLLNENTTTEIHGESEKLKSGNVVKGINAIDSFSFSLLPSNVGFGLIQDYKTLVTVYNTNKKRYEFYGRVLFSHTAMDESGLITKEVTCESFLGFLCDSKQNYVTEKNWTVLELLTHIIDTHNSQVEEYKHFAIGEVSDELDPNNNLYLGIQRDNSWKTIEEKLLKKLGGEIRIRVIDGVTYLDYLKEIGETKATKIQLSKNMKSITRECDPSSFISRLIPLGAKVSEDSEERLDITSVNNGLNYIEDENAREAYGIRVEYVEFDDVTLASNLLQKGREYLAENNKVQVKYTIKALDLSLLGLDIDDFEVCNYHPIENKLLGIDDVARIIKENINVCDEVASTIDVGDNFKTLSELQMEQAMQMEQAIKNAQQVVSTTNALKENVSQTEEIVNDLSVALREEIREQNTSLSNSFDEILLSALESYVLTSNYEEFKHTVEAQLAILADEIILKFTDTTEQIENVDGTMQTKFAEIYKHFSFSENGLVIGSGDSAMTLIVDNDKISFQKNGVQFGFWDGVDFHTGNIVVEVNERAQFGNFAFVPRSDGSLSFLKVGG